MYTNEQQTLPPPHPRRTPEYPAPVSAQALRELFAACADFETRQIDFGLDGKLSLQVCWLDGLVSGEAVTEDVLRPLTQSVRAGGADDEGACIERILHGAVYRCSVHLRRDLDSLVADLTHGHCAVVFSRSRAALTFELRARESRAVSEPTLEKSLKGAKDSFVETLRINTSLVRRRVCTPRLKLAESTVGRKTHTRVAVLFVEGVAAPEIVTELIRRLNALDVDALLGVGTLEEAVVDAPFSPYPQLLHTERPDRFAMHLLDGRVGLLIDGLPLGLVLPVTFAEFMKVTGDGSVHFTVATLLTLLRYLALSLSMLLPAVYTAVAMYHQEMIPTRLLLSIIEAEQSVPFSTALEVLGMLAAFSLLQEAGLRLPDPIGDTVSIIGALIVGQAAVEARVVSPIAIIVVAVSGICCYTLPSQDMGFAVRLTRLGLLLAAIAGGLFGVGVGCCLLLLHLGDLDSFGRNYTAPLSDGRPWGVLRLLLRPPRAWDKLRDPQLRTPDRRHRL
ncbi:MAG: spore germination protein [Oscillospiraceae bacterium]|nr:spore germination protein [Oscillospiraceae bacterium]